MKLLRRDFERLLPPPGTADKPLPIWCSPDAAPQHRNARTVLPGAFNPLHAGHTAMAAVAEDLLGSTVDFEISVVNVDKPDLTYADVTQRMNQFAHRANLWLTNAPTFVAKAAWFPEATFVVGMDTLARIAAPRYYADNLSGRDTAVEQLATLGIRFLVFGRVYQGKFQTLADLSLPPALRALCDEVPATQFRKDISSTELRNDSSAGNT
ncbi:MAG: hypothetical protein CL681_11825 [Blastopirellula sp.]|nr:hypothetical protein [Blastopirellula sp.]